MKTDTQLPRECPHKLSTGAELPQTFSRENSLATQQAHGKTANSLPISNNSLTKWEDGWDSLGELELLIPSFEKTKVSVISPKAVGRCKCNWLY